jgi:hypothetical protein
VNFEIGYFGVGCDFKNSFIHLMFVKLSLPLALWVCLVLVEVVSKRGRPEKHRINAITANCIFLGVFFSTQIFSSMFQVFNCVLQDGGGGSYFLKADPQIQCYSSLWYRVVTIDVVFMFFYFVVLPCSFYEDSWRPAENS